MRKTLKNVVHRSRMIATYLVIGRHIYWGTKLVLSKMRPYIVRCKKHLLRNIPNTCKKQEIRRWRGDTSFERRGTSRKKKFVSSEMWETRVTEWKKRHAFRWKRKKETFEENGRQDLLRETRNETYLMKNGTSQEMYGILRATWWLTLRKLGNFNRIQSKKHFFSSDGRVASPDTQEHYFTSSRWKRRETSWTGT